MSWFQVRVFLWLCTCVCVCLSVLLSTMVHQQYLIFHCTSTIASSSSRYKQTQPCLQMKINIDEIKLGKEYLISELNVWIKLGFLYWIKPVGIGSISSIWENIAGKYFFFLFAMKFPDVNTTCRLWRLCEFKRGRQKAVILVSVLYCAAAL